MLITNFETDIPKINSWTTGQPLATVMGSVHPSRLTVIFLDYIYIYTLIYICKSHDIYIYIYLHTYFCLYIYSFRWIPMNSLFFSSGAGRNHAHHERPQSSGHTHLDLTIADPGRKSGLRRVAIPNSFFSGWWDMTNCPEIWWHMHMS